MNNGHGIPDLTDMLTGKPVQFAPLGEQVQTYRVHGNVPYYRSNKTESLLHRDIWERVNGCPLPAKWQVNHIDGCKWNNDPANLEAVTQKGANYKDLLRMWRQQVPGAL